MDKKEFLKSVIYNRNSYQVDVLVASWASEVTEILTQRGTEEASVV